MHRLNRADGSGPAGRRPRRARAALGLLLLAALAAGCATTPELRISPRYAAAVRQIRLVDGRLAWGNLAVGITREQAERTLGRRLPALAGPGELCDSYTADTEMLDQRMTLELAGASPTAELRAIGLYLAPPGGRFDRDEVVAALRARLPGLEYVPGPHQPDLPEERVERPLYRVGDDQTIWVVPDGALWLGHPCWD